MKKLFNVLVCFFFLISVFFCTAEARTAFIKESQPAKRSFSSPGDPYIWHKTHKAGKLWLTISNWGFMGGHSGAIIDPFTLEPYPSAEFPGGSDLEYLFQGALWVGGVVEGETLVSVCADGWLWLNEMFPDEYPEGKIIERNYLADNEFIAVYTDTLTQGIPPDDYDGRPHKPLGVKITQHSYSWASPPYDDFVILEYTIQNIGNKGINDLYVGQYMDQDISHVSSSVGFRDDISGFLKNYLLPESSPETDLVWSADNDGDPTSGNWTYRSVRGILGIRYLGASSSNVNKSFHWWVSEGNNPENLDFGPWLKSNWDLWNSIYGDWCEGGKGTPCGDRAKYFLMSNQEKDYDQIYTCIDKSAEGWLPPPAICSDLANGYDTRYLFSVGPFDLTAGDSVSIAFAFVAGENLHNKPVNPIDPKSPDNYYSNLNFTDFVRNSWAAMRAYESGYLLPPPGPPFDFRVVNIPPNEALFYWSPKNYRGLKGYNLYRSNTSGVYPTAPVNEVPITDTSYVDKGLIEGENYFYVIKSVNSLGIEGASSEEIDFLAGRPVSPSCLMAGVNNNNVNLSWCSHPEEDVISYMIYRKEEGGDWVSVGSVGLAGLDTTFCDKTTDDGVVYYYQITAVDRLGLESFPSDSVYALRMNFDQGILLVDMSNPDGRVFVQDDSVNAFYNRALQGYPFVYAKHDQPFIQYVSLKELSPYSVGIIHSEGRYGPSYSFDSTLVNLRRYLEAGGKLILVGKNLIQPSDFGYFKKGDFPYDILHLYSIFYPLFWSCGEQEFIGTNSTLPSEFADLEVDTARVNLSYPKDRCDLQGRLPFIGYFVPLYPEEVIYTFNSIYDTSNFEGKAIGMRHVGDDYKVYFLDFPLYYIQEEQSVPLLHKILAEFGFSLTGVEEELVTLPKDFSLGQNYPNPFNPTTTIPFNVTSSQFMVHNPIHTTLTVYNILGQKVRVLLDKELRVGGYEVVWDGKDEKGKEVSTGIYFYQLKTGDYKETKKMILLR